MTQLHPDGCFGGPKQRKMHDNYRSVSLTMEHKKCLFAWSFQESETLRNQQRRLTLPEFAATKLIWKTEEQDNAKVSNRALYVDWKMLENDHFRQNL